MPDQILSLFLRKIRHLKPQIFAIYLFGSRARKIFHPDSDYDILIVPKEKNKILKSKIYDAVVDILLSTGKEISLKFISEDRFNELARIPSPLLENILKEGVKIG